MADQTKAAADLHSKATGALASAEATEAAATSRLTAANTAATKAASSAEAARSAAQAAQGEAEKSRDAAATAKDAADSARDAAQSEREKASLAGAAAGPSKDAAEVQRAAAETSATQAAASRDAAEAAKGAAVVARELTDGEKVKAADAAKGATAAAGEADAASAEANRAAQAAETANSATQELQRNTATVLHDIEEALAEGRKWTRVAEQGAHDARSEAKKASAEAKGAAEAHNLSTTAGLAGAFNERALSAGWVTLIWAALLVASLVAAFSLGYSRYADLTKLLATGPAIQTLVAELLLALFGVAAPVWLAWISTKMISKNFAIREDYAYKTALAKAYLGFREQARNLDPILEQRLFAAAVTQLDSNPARFIDPAHPGSPLQDLLQQEFMQKVLEDASVKQLMLEWLKSRFKTSLPSKVAADAASKAMAPNVTAMFHAPPTMSGAAVAATPPSLPS